jgi:hypothetical protein
MNQGFRKDNSPEKSKTRPKVQEGEIARNKVKMPRARSSIREDNGTGYTTFGEES